MGRLLRIVFALGLLMAPGAVRAGETRHVGIGIVRGIEAGGKVVVLDHQAIPGFMEAMTMPYEVADPVLTRGLKKGDRVRFTVVKKGDFWPIVALVKLSQGPAKRTTSHRPGCHAGPALPPRNQKPLAQTSTARS